MPEILTESFCERCGTRYTFESSAPRTKRIGRVKVLSRGLKNFVMSDGTTLNEALAAARSDEEREVVSHQLDAFHKTFNFCMTCRQYTCSNCWNETEGRCLTCAPHLGHDLLAAPYPQVDANGNGTHPAVDSMAWPTTDLRQPTSGAAVGAEAWPDDEIAPNELADRLAALGVVPVEAEARADVIEVGAEPAAVAAVDEAPLAAVEPELEVAAPAEADVVPAVEAEPEKVIAAAEPDGMAAVEAEPEPVIAAAEPEGMPAIEAEPELVFEAAEPEVTPAVDAEPEVTPAVDAEPEILAGARPAAETVAAPELEIVEPAEPEPEAPAVAALPPEPEAPAVAVEPESVPAAEAPAAAPVPPAPLTLEERAAAAAAQTAQLLARFRPGQSIDAALDAYEASLAEAEAVPAPAEPETVAASTPEPVAQPEPEPVVPAVPQPVEVLPEPEPVLAAQPEPEPIPVAAAQPEPEPIPVAATQPAPEPVAPVEPEPIAATQPAPELAAPTQAAPKPVPAVEPAPAVAPAPPAPTRDDRVELPAWRIVAPDTPSTVDGHPAGEPALPAAASAEPQWPSTPQWPASQQPDAESLAFLTAKLTRNGSEDLWAASNREVLSAQSAAAAAAAAPAVQSCISCGLSLSANARFCRRCGTRQGG